MTVVVFRDATRADVPALVDMLRDDLLGQGREADDLAPYLAGFDEIAANPCHQLIVGEIGGRVVATCQLTILSGLSRQGARRALVEAVRVASTDRGHGIGALLMAECEARARKAGCAMIQLTTDRARVAAHRFYARLGYEASHLGMKKPL